MRGGEAERRGRTASGEHESRAQKGSVNHLDVSPGRIPVAARPISAVMVPRGRHESRRGDDTSAGSRGFDWRAILPVALARRPAELLEAVFLYHPSRQFTRFLRPLADFIGKDDGGKR